MSVSDSSPTAAPHRYSERLRVPWWWTLAAVAVIVLLGIEIEMAVRTSWAPLSYVVLVPLAAWLLWSMSRAEVSVDDDGTLRAADASLPRWAMARVASVPPSAKSAALGRQLDPAAFLVHRFWIKSMVLIVLDDPDDPTPYWLVSTRRPAALIAALGFDDARRATTDRS